MKKIALWKIVLLSIVTLGIYALIWLILRRNEIVRQYGQHVPHWLWLILPTCVGSILWFVSLLLIYGFNPNDPGKQYDWMMLGTYGFLVIIPFAISLWWIDHFGQSVQIITNGRVPVLWTMLLYFFLGPIIIIIHQYYFNRVNVTKPLPENSTARPTQQFLIVASLLLVIAAGFSIPSWVALPEAYRQSRNDFISNVQKE